jgi:2,3-bisphosphoglycerate-independent phosphoglycerate mutase
MISSESNLKLKNGKLADIAPTILDIMSLDIPIAMNGRSLLVK